MHFNSQKKYEQKPSKVVFKVRKVVEILKKCTIKVDFVNPWKLGEHFDVLVG